MNQPILQIIHYSDMHIVGPNYLKQRHRFAKLLRHLPVQWRQGVEGPDRGALSAFVDFLRDEISKDPDWQGCDTWLVDTGDGTTFGDDDSLDEWINNWSVKFLVAAPRGTEPLRLYGNHDAWPGEFPPLAPWKIPTHRNNLRAKWFRDVWPAPPLQVPISNAAGSEIQLYVLNSVDHGTGSNTLALGKAMPDRFWENPAPNPGPTAGADLERMIGQHAGGAKGRHVRILAMHYPVSDATTQGARFQKVLANRQDLADELQAPKSPYRPLAHLIVGGHTHVGFPVAGLLPNSAHSATHVPLGPGQCQMVVSTLSQVCINAPIASGYYPDECLIDFPYQCQVLRFSNLPTNPYEITIERSIAGCRPGGDFAFLPIAENSDRFTEEMTLVI